MIFFLLSLKILNVYLLQLQYFRITFSLFLCQCIDDAGGTTAEGGTTALSAAIGIVPQLQ